METYGDFRELKRKQPMLPEGGRTDTQNSSSNHHFTLKKCLTNSEMDVRIKTIKSKTDEKEE